MSTIECHFIEEIPVQALDDRRNIYSRQFTSSDLTRKRSQEARLHEIEQQLHVAENKCNTLKDQIDYMRMMCHNSSERLNVVDSNKRNPKCQGQYSSNSPKYTRAFSNTSVTPHKEVLPLKDNELIYPVRDVGVKNTNSVSTQMQCDANRNKVFAKDDTDNLIRTTTKRSIPATKHTLKKGGSKINHTVSDTYVQNVMPIYNGTKKIPATSNVQRKSYKTARSMKICDSRDTIRTARKKLKQIKHFDSKKYKLSDKANSKVNNDDVMSIFSNRMRKRRIRNKQITSRSTAGHSIKHASHGNSDLVELYHNNKAKSFTSNSENSLATTRRGIKKAKTVIVPRVHTIPSHRTYQKYTTFSSNYSQQNYGQNFNLLPAKIKQTTPIMQRRAITHPNQVKLKSFNSSVQQSALEQQQQQMQEYQQYCQQYYQQYYQSGYNYQQQPSPQNMQQQKSQYPTPYNWSQSKNSNTQHVGDIPIVERTSRTVQQPNDQDCYQNYQNKCLTPIDEKSAYSYQKSYPSTYVYNDRHYQLPTISSRLKQVTKCYLQQFNFKTIPFVTAKSTTPSHNLGLNIQQVLSIMKTHQPITGISPTLAHNMGLVAQSNGSFARGTEDTINHLLSRMGSRQNCNMGSRRQVCPLLRQATAIAETELEDVPEHPCEDNESVVISPRINSTLPVQVSKPVLDQNELNNRAATEWDQANPQPSKVKCTCLPKKGTTCNRVFNQYMNPDNYSASCQHIGGNGGAIRTQTNSNMSMTQTLTGRTRTKQYKSAFSMHSADPIQYQYHNIPPAENQPMPAQTLNSVKSAQSKVNFHSQLAGKVRGLREVLANLHDDFQKMNDKYDLLSKQVQSNMVKDPDALRQLEEMEKDLNAKEEEITVVISLYKEVLALKEQVRTLKERTSVLSMSMYTSPSTTSQKRSSNCEPTVTLRLTKLLRQIQHFQGLIKQRP